MLHMTGGLCQLCASASEMAVACNLSNRYNPIPPILEGEIDNTDVHQTRWGTRPVGVRRMFEAEESIGVILRKAVAGMKSVQLEGFDFVNHTTGREVCIPVIDRFPVLTGAEPWPFNFFAAIKKRQRIRRHDD